MQRQLIATFAASLILLPGLAFADSKTLDVGQFHGIDAASGIRVVVGGGKPYSAVAEAADPKDLSDLRHEVRDGVLRLWYDWTVGDIFDWSRRDVTVTVGAELLDRLEASSGASIEASGMMGEDITLEASSGASIRANAVEGMFYDIDASSGARIETSGLCNSADIEVSSGASVAAAALDCAKASLEASSGASLEVAVRETISADVSSGAHITVHGRPTVERLETSSGGNVAFRD